MVIFKTVHGSWERSEQDTVPDFEVQLQSSLNQYGAIINTEGQVILNQNSVPTGTVLSKRSVGFEHEINYRFLKRTYHTPYIEVICFQG